jgi:hypothetical protein
VHPPLRSQFPTDKAALHMQIAFVMTVSCASGGKPTHADGHLHLRKFLQCIWHPTLRLSSPHSGVWFSVGLGCFTWCHRPYSSCCTYCLAAVKQPPAFISCVCLCRMLHRGRTVTTYAVFDAIASLPPPPFPPPAVAIHFPFNLSFTWWVPNFDLWSLLSYQL